MASEDDFRVRKLEMNDKDKGFIELLQQLTECNAISDDEFRERFEEIAKYGDDHVICVVEDVKEAKIVATGSVFVERKFVRKCGKVGHIEDVVVDYEYRMSKVGKKVVEFLVDHASTMGCYKVILDCPEKNTQFYEKCGFKQKEIQMVKYFV